jgi:hypothetical protein
LKCTLSPALSFTPDDNGAYLVRLTATDKDGGVGSDSATITVGNVRPTVGALTLSAATIPEHGIVTLTGTFADPGVRDTHTVTIDWGDGSEQTVLSLAAGVTTLSATHQYADDNPTNTASDTTTISVMVTDNDHESGSGATTVTVENVTPAISGITGPTGPLALGTAASITASFTDVGSKDTHRCTFAWDDGSPTTTATAIGIGTKSCTAARTYTAAGVYTVAITVTDDDTGAATQTFEFVVVYDPSGGFVTGGGWITSPVGAYAADPALSGKASFGFVAKYKKGATIPEGQTEFQFHVANVTFPSDTYQWLVVAGAWAQFKGTGSLNGQSGYGFQLTATDGQQPGGGGVDKFRIKVWRLSDGGWSTTT